MMDIFRMLVRLKYSSCLNFSVLNITQINCIFRYSWTQDGIFLVDSATVQLQGSKLVIDNAKARNSGVYQCFAENQYGRDMSDQLVLEKAIFRPEDQKAYIQVQRIGDHVSMDCDIPKSCPLGPIKWWTRNSTQQSVIFNRGRFTIDYEGMNLFQVYCRYHSLQGYLDLSL